MVCRLGMILTWYLQYQRRFHRRDAKHAKNSLTKTVKRFALFAPLRLFV
jgi:hypothetical protein